MPRTAASKRALRNTKIRTTRNVTVKLGVRDAVRKVRKLSAAGKKDEAATAWRAAASKLDRAVKRGLYNKAKVARIKSRLAKLVNKSANSKVEVKK